MKKFLLASIAFLFILTACGQEATPTEDQLDIVTTVYPVYNMVEYIGGDEVNVIDIYPPGSDAHHYQLTSNDISTITDSDMFFYTADNLEYWVTDLEGSGEYDTEFINISEDPTFKDNADASLYTVDEDGNSTITDPHIWMSPDLLYLMNDVITEKRCAAKPESCSEFEQRSTELDAEIKQLDQDLTDFASTNEKTIIVAHEAYNYLTIDYGIPIVGLYGVSEEDEPSAEDIKEAIELIESQEINTIYAEQNDEENQAIVQVSNETNTDVAVLNNMETVSQEDFDNKTSFIEIYERNLTALEAI